MSQSLGQILRWGVVSSLCLMAAGKLLGLEYFMWLGVFLLIFLPALRIAWVGIHFFQAKEFKMGWISLLVLALLLGSFFLGHASS